MQFEIVTIFPEFFAGPLDYGIVRRAREARLVDVRVHDLRAFTHDRHRTVDDRPFGGGEGMVLKPEPLFEAVESLLGDGVPPGGRAKGNSDIGFVGARFTENVLRERHAVPLQGEATPTAGKGTAIVLLSASGKLFRQDTARRFAQLDRIILLCGRYEGVDERVAEHLATDELSIGDFVLSGGELGAALIMDAVTRLLPGALGNEDSTVNESFSVPADFGDGEVQITGHGSRDTNHVLLDCPHYTRPAEFRGWNVPEVLLGGNHEEIRRWRLQKALEKTRRNRPDLLGNPGPLFEDADTTRKA
ncbi:MAG TPA: tRNA (guanosine(37)-N1)-methyltransferase TrmD [Verrucomicrobiae bacterium]|nr:tRNA (guanosine(37)-N1)-methyltransferase TrmD [Verrucomicrobiae bacterium]